MNTSYIEKFHCQGFRKFRQLDVEFNPGFNFLTGPNGCGKTSVLVGIATCLSHQGALASRVSSVNELWIDITDFDAKYRVGHGAGALRSTPYGQQAGTTAVPPEQCTVDKDRVSVSPGIFPNNVNFNWFSRYAPLFIGAVRNIPYQRINSVRREDDQIEFLQKIRGNGPIKLSWQNENNVKQWLINRYFFIDKEWARETRQNWIRLIEALPKLAPFDSHFKFVDVKQDLEPIFSLYGKECYLEELSFGFQSILTIIATIIEWVENGRDEGSRQIEFATGTVLIDEIDAHLHPEWQFTLRDGLEKLFPKLQFIVTTHSPHVLASARENEIIQMDPARDNEGYSVKASPMSYRGWKTDNILSEVMKVESLEKGEYQSLIKLAEAAITSKDNVKFEEVIRKLAKIAHPSDSVVQVLKVHQLTEGLRRDD